MRTKQENTKLKSKTVKRVTKSIDQSTFYRFGDIFSLRNISSTKSTGKGEYANRVTAIMALFISLFGISTSFSPSASALSYSDSIDPQFTFNPTIKLTITGDNNGNLRIDSLAPSSLSDSNIITISASSNSLHGYSLYATTGNTTNSSTELRKGGTDTTNKFSSITTNKASLNDFDPNQWGYAYSTNSGSTWVSGNTGSTATGYNGLPIYTNTGIKLADTSSNSDTSLQFKIGAKASSTQLSGEYTNVVNFTTIAKVVSTSYAINYNDATGEASGMPSQQTGTTNDGVVILSSTVPTRDDYTFKGWCTVNNSTDPTSCNNGTTDGTIVKPGGTLALGSGSSTTVTVSLYAVWVSNSKKITDLTDTTWYFNETPVFSLENLTIYYIDLSFSGMTSNMIVINGAGYLKPNLLLNGNGSDGMHYGFFSKVNIYSGWGIYDEVDYAFTPDQQLRTIHITGGADATNIELINWVQSNATQQ